MSRIGRACRPLLAPFAHREPTIFDQVVVLPQVLDWFRGKFLVSTEHRVYALDMGRRLIVEAPIDPDAPNDTDPRVSPRFNRPIPHPRPISRIHQCVEGRLLYLDLRSNHGARDEVYFAPHVTMILIVPYIPAEWMP